MKWVILILVVIKIFVAHRTPDVQVLITSIHLRDLKNTGSIIDPQDPCVHVAVGAAEYRSGRKTDAGTEALFEEEVLLDVTDDELTGKVSRAPQWSCLL